ncbi:glycosyltransferase family 2 protein [Serratia quinivorans]|jgi:glycosyltransferase involved in cell wall biosynthesis|uniref:glycosyltransferase family 2 protein n=1 Tax=Serratia quinivorans TaxID=137545 RepID=UPI002179819C|nr:glycosyltransferase family 2 protein [Serratia quinivorans]CAI1929755.1 Chondroitin polymerase [Serratia quinivorans]CAI2003890.1 Chondroitin polymerase [Serratia quinivorans]
MPAQRILLSIIIAAHNSGNYLKDTLHSLLEALGNSITKCEIILVNDASTDDTAVLLTDFAHAIPQANYFHVVFKNIGKVRNFAIANSNGDYITMLDSDDLLKNGSLQEILDFLEAKDPDLLLTKLHEVHTLVAADKIWKGLQPEKLSVDEAITRFLNHKDFQAHLIGQFIKRPLLQASPIPAFSCYEDFYVFPDLLTQSKKIVFSRESHYLYIKRDTSLSNSPSEEKMHNLFVCTERMDAIFGERFHDLVLCHWLDMQLKQKQWITEPEQLDILNKKIRDTRRIGFFFNPSVRFSYKRKAVETLWKK